MDSLIQIFRSISPLTGGTTNLISSDSKRQIITKLKFISLLEPHEKIDINSLKIESSGIWTPLKRLIAGSSRDTTVNFFGSTIDRTFEIIQASLSSERMADRIFVANTLTDLINAIRGLRAAQTTYADDKLVVCNIESQIESVQGFIMEIQEKHSDILTLKEACVVSLEKTLGKRNSQLASGGGVLSAKEEQRRGIPLPVIEEDDMP